MKYRREYLDRGTVLFFDYEIKDKELLRSKTDKVKIIYQGDKISLLDLNRKYLNKKFRKEFKQKLRTISVEIA